MTAFRALTSSRGDFFFFRGIVLLSILFGTLNCISVVTPALAGPVSSKVFPWLKTYGEGAGLTSGNIEDLVVHGDRLYAAVKGQGVMVLDGENFKPVLSEDRISGGTVTRLVSLPKGLLVAAETGSVTVGLADPAAPAVNELISGSRVVDAVEFNDRLWLATETGLVKKGPEGLEEITRINREILGRVSSFTIFDGKLFVGTYGKGIFFFDPKKDEWTEFSEDQGLQSLYVNSLASDSRYIFVGTDSGVEYFDSVSGNWHRHGRGVAGTGIAVRLAGSKVIRVIPEGNMAWFGTTEGITSYVLEVFEDYKNFVGEAPPENTFLLPKKCPCRLRWNNLTQSGGLPPQEVTSMVLFNSDLWVGTKGGGLLKFDGFYIHGDGWNEFFKIIRIAISQGKVKSTFIPPSDAMDSDSEMPVQAVKPAESESIRKN